MHHEVGAITGDKESGMFGEHFELNDNTMRIVEEIGMHMPEFSP